MPRSKTEAAASKVKTATALATLGGGIAGPFGAGAGAITGLIIGDDPIIMPVDMIAIPAYQYSSLVGNNVPAFSIYIKEGEVLTQVMATDAEEAAEEIAISSLSPAPKKKRKLSAWNRYVKKKSNQIRYKSGKNKGKLNLAAMAKKGGFGKKKKGRKK